MKRCSSCHALVESGAESCPDCGTRFDIASRWPGRRTSYAIFSAIIVGLLVVSGAFLFVKMTSADEAKVSMIKPGSHVLGSIGPGTRLGIADKPYIDYTLVVPRYGTYEIDLASELPSAFDPLVSLERDDLLIATDDDSGEGVDAKVRETLKPGRYVVRVSSKKAGPMDEDVNFLLTIRRVADSVA